ncbi:MAG: hypothetical protein AAF570_09095, partial [Bacteroidota bacterium]
MNKLENRFSSVHVPTDGRTYLRYDGEGVFLAGPASHAIMSHYPDPNGPVNLRWEDGFNYVRVWMFEAFLRVEDDPKVDNVVLGDG